MRFKFSERQDEFREEVRAFLRAELPNAVARGEVIPGRIRGYSRDFSAALAARGWIGLSWPREFGGAGADAMTQVIFTEEMIVSEAPCGYHFVAERQIGPSLIRHGTDEQRKKWVSRIIAGDVSFCLGLSESAAGSDLAAIQTRAERRGDHYVVNGSKIWSSNAQISDVMWLVVRTDPDVPKHKGISILMLDLKSPGIDIRPLYDLTGEWYFNEVFLHDVQVPVENRFGDENAGWYLLAQNLDFERSGIEMVLEGGRWLARILRALREAPAGMPGLAAARDQAAQISIDMEIGRLLCYRVAHLQAEGRVPNHEAAMSKMFGSELVARVARLAVALAPSCPVLRSADSGVDADYAYMRSISRTISGGTSEIQRNIIATRGLGLPR